MVFLIQAPSSTGSHRTPNQAGAFMPAARDAPHAVRRPVPPDATSTSVFTQ